MKLLLQSLKTDSKEHLKLERARTGFVYKDEMDKKWNSW